ncbi:ATP-binding protein [Sphingomonas sp. So64.6b]|uniref:ATP-binding protein n=1 Tax=Sphingomonas sp. So64.6b TaxID=2997354 RepID=UPI001FCEB7BE|nr:ATP-binding protein [Sphingomonas sp. So64.6b]
MTALVSPRAIAPADATASQNMLQLVQLRWLAIAGQCVTILLTHYAFGIALPIVPMLAVLAGLALLNAISMLWLRSGRPIDNRALLVALLLDVLCLSVQLYFSGGATNPFVSLFLLQVVLGSVLLKQGSTWVVVVVTSIAFALLTIIYRPIVLPGDYSTSLFQLHVQGMWVCFALVAVLLVMFVTRINRNLRARDAHLAAMQRQAAEEDHIVRIGLLASGAAHELGTPLSSLSVILGDWRRAPGIAGDPDLVNELGEMQAEVQRCKAIVTGILLAAGEARGEASTVTSVRAFFGRVVADWQAARGFTGLHYDDAFGADVPIVSDTVLQQMLFNLLDNAAEASSDEIRVDLARDGDILAVTVADRGSGFAAATLDAIGAPYNSTKRTAGAGLGLFLVTNVMRKLGGTVQARNRRDGGAEVVLRLPLSALELTE